MNKRRRDLMVDTGSYPGTPRWVKTFAFVAVLVAGLALLHKLFGVSADHHPHPGREAHPGSHMGVGPS
jgi:hypothetical protein